MGRPRKIKTAKEFDRKANAYFAQCVADEEPITLTGLVIALGLSSKQRLYEYLHRDEFSESVKSALTRVEHAYEKRLTSPNAAGVIFALKNFEWSDKTQLDHTSSDGSMSPVRPDELTDEQLAAIAAGGGKAPASS